MIEKRRRVGILGGSGNIGSKVIKLLENDYEIIATYRGRFCKDTPFCKYRKLDINNIDDLNLFCKDIDILLNCAGASYNNGEYIARIATKWNVPYIDPSGEGFLESKLEDISDKNIFVLSAGYFPGLSGILAKYVCQELDEIDFLKGLSISEEIPSKSALEDFILTSISDFGKSMHSYINGKLVYDDAIKYKQLFGKTYILKNYITKEFIRISKEFNIKCCNWYSRSQDEEIIKKIQSILGDESINGNINSEIIDSIIYSIQNKTTNDKFSFINIKAEGNKADNLEKINIDIMANQSGDMSAFLAMETIKEVISNILFKNKVGIYYAMDILSPGEIVSKLKTGNYGVAIKERIEVYENGEI